MGRRATTSMVPELSTRSLSSIQSPPHSPPASPMTETNGTISSRRPEPPQSPRHPPNIRGQNREAFGPVTRSRHRRMMESAARGGSSMEERFVASQTSPHHRSGRRRARESDSRRDYSVGRGHVLRDNQSYMPNQRVQDYLVGVGSFDPTQPRRTSADSAPAMQNIRQERTPEDFRTLEEELGNMVREMRERRRRDRQQIANRPPRSRMPRAQSASYQQLEHGQDTIPLHNGRPRQEADITRNNIQ
ncbi:hypothetical protein BGZ63DRAFT_192628 [Mariannaea sp. PMI_226]|nr:hypothetical protein BGZ63DRAFT_192628 [Mariannaea sp. PMI_226]